jgi:hypothetical protein
VSEAQRRDMGCGWLATSWVGEPAPWSWKHPSGAGPRCVTCPGFTTELPEVIEVASLFVHYESNQVIDALGGERPAPATFDGFAILKRACGALMGAKAKEPR